MLSIGAQYHFNMKESIINLLEPLLKTELSVEVTPLRGKRFAVTVSGIPLHSMESNEDLLYLVKNTLASEYSKRTIALSIFNFKRNVKTSTYTSANVRAMRERFGETVSL